MAEGVFLSLDNKLHSRRDGAALDLSALAAATVAFTQTYANTTATVPAATAAAVDATGSTSTVPFGFSQTQADAIVTNLNAVIADSLANRKLLNQIIDVLQAALLAT